MKLQRAGILALFNEIPTKAFWFLSPGQTVTKRPFCDVCVQIFSVHFLMLFTDFLFNLKIVIRLNTILRSWYSEELLICIT